jgi:hypothetical protein
VVANGASMQMVEGSIPIAPRSSYDGSRSDHVLEGNLVKLFWAPITCLVIGHEVYDICHSHFYSEYPGIYMEGALTLYLLFSPQLYCAVSRPSRFRAHPSDMAIIM